MWRPDYAAILIAVTGVLYAGTTTAFFFTGRPWMAVAYLGYTIGNVGLFMIAMGGK